MSETVRSLFFSQLVVISPWSVLLSESLSSMQAAIALYFQIAYSNVMPQINCFVTCVLWIRTGNLRL
jgi:hypothetical protein